ncbi:Six-hairpin glycosidase-like protein [Xylariomycetidae sp. FL2044]|nr:Six-hairpin glycosidase-like protein [Xylariomycetidae sp. FL2044]
MATLWMIGAAAAVLGLAHAKPCGLSPPAGNNTTDLITTTPGTTTLTASVDAPAIVVLDYGRSVEGVPSFEVLTRDGDTSIFEITYAESHASLSTYQSDGPLPLAAAMDTYRVNRYNITEPGVVSNRLVQGAFRYQKLNLTSPGVLQLRNVGVRPTISTTALSDLPGSFESSDDTLNNIWSAGSRTVQMTEIPADSVPDFWEVSPEGALVESLAPQVLGSAEAAQLLYYNLNFRVKPLVGGFGFTVLADTLSSGIYFSCDLDSRKIAAYAGSTTYNTLLQSFDLPANLTLGTGSWATVDVTVAITDITVAINGLQAVQMSQTTSFYGSFGLGASFGHRAVFQNLSASSATGEEIYAHPLTDSSFLPDFFMGTNPASTVVDGSRRDRITYTGDLDIAGAAALASTHGLEFVLGSLDLLGSYQATPGFFIPSAKIQQAPLSEALNVNITGLIGYSFNLVTALASTYMHTGEIDFATRWAPKVQKLLDWADSQTLDNGLLNISDSSFAGDWNYYDPVQAGVSTKFNVLYAYSLQESSALLEDGGVDASVYQQRLESLRTAIDSQLWSDELQAYYVSDEYNTGFGQDSNAIAILAGVNQNASHSSDIILSTLSSQLMTASGPLAFSSEMLASGFQSYISPYASAYHLRAALASGASDVASELLRSLWAPMADAGNANYTGTFWETLDQDGRPGLGLATSLCHGWSAGPTAELTKYVLGATPTKPGWAQFKIAPLTLGLTSARGRVPLVGGQIDVDWSYSADGLLSMTVDAPSGTTGTLSLPTLRVSGEHSLFTVDGQAVNGSTFTVTGGTTFSLRQVQ